MNSIISLLGLLLLALCSVATASTTGDWGRQNCKSPHPNVQNAIEKFCNKSSKMFTPTYWASHGQKTGNAGVKITGKCNPMQYIPWNICFQQFYDICASGNKRGEGVRYFGGGCQKWEITNPLVA